MNNFENAYNFVKKWEGHLTDDPNDSGGITNYGISLRFLQSINPKATREDIINLTPLDAKHLFKVNFWDKCCLDFFINEKLAFAFFDGAVNLGCPRATRFLQAALVKQGQPVDVDGVVGEKTIAAVNLVCATEPDTLIRNMLNLRESFYRKISSQVPKNAVFLTGWLNRLNALRHTLYI